MKADVLLFVGADPVSTEVVARVASKTSHRLLCAQTSREASRLMNSDLGQVDLIVVDVDPGSDGLAVLEATDVTPTAPPVIVLTSLEEIYMAPLAAAHGAAACLGKPFSVERLAAVIEQVSRPAWREAGWTSDAWGHPHRCRNNFAACPGCRHQRPEPVPTPVLATS